jgi:phage gp16-like protein
VNAASDTRRAELAKIHIAAKRLGMEDDAYRAMLWAVARARSAADLDEAGRRRVLDHLKARGFKSKRKSRPRPSQDREALVGKVRAMLRGMDLSDEYADGMSKKMFHVERYEWCNPDQLHRLVAALEYHKRRSQRKPA